MSHVKRWFDETHGTVFELVRHFLPRFFDSELTPSSGAWSGVATGVVSVLISSWMILAFVLLSKYRRMADLKLSGQRIAAETAADQWSLTAIAVCLTLLLLAALWQSIYPTLRDCLSLAALPVRPREMFAAKFLSLALVFALFLVILPVPAAAVLGIMSGASSISIFLTIASHCIVAFFGAIALQGVLLNLLPMRTFEAAAVWMQASLVALAVGGMSFASVKAPALAGILSRAPLTALFLVPPAAAMLAYSASYHRYRRILLEAPQNRVRQGIGGAAARLTERVIELWIRDPRELAVFHFFWMTLRRSQLHRLAVLLYAALAVAWLLQTGTATTLPGMAPTEAQGMFFTVYPLVLILITLLGLRQLFALPADLRANWIFQISEREGRQSWMRATRRFVFLFGIAPVTLTGGILATIQNGPWVGVAWTALAAMFAATLFEYLFRDWCKLPFTCSYLPGKRPLLVNVALFVCLSPFLLPVAYLLFYSAANPASLLVMLTVECGVWMLFRTARLRTWGVRPLRYEELPEADVDVFRLNGEGTTLSQEEFQREWSDYVRGGGPSESIVRPLAADETRSSRVREWLSAVPQDLRYAIRMLVKAPGFTVAIILTLGLGLGLNSAFFTVFNAFLLRPLAVRDPASLASVELEARGGSLLSLSWQEYRALASSGNPFQGIAASTFIGTGLDAKSTFVNLVSANYFPLLGVPPALGRTFHPGEDAPVIVLSHRTWQSRFGGDPNVLGRSVILNGKPFEIVGVTGPQFSGVPVGTVELAPKEMVKFGAATADCWAPLEAWMRMPGFEAVPVRGLVGRLQPGDSTAKLEGILMNYARRLSEVRPQYDRIYKVSVETFDIPVTWTTLSYSLPLLIAFALTMLIPCANAANILLARATARQREIGTRLSLGAGRGRVMRQLLTEGMLLSVLAAVAGLLVARLALDVLAKVIGSTAPATLLRRFRLPDFTLDQHVFFYMFCVAGVTTLAFALAPAAQSTRMALSSALRGDFGFGRASTLRDGLVVAQVALCVMMLASSIVLLRGTHRVTGIERGYDATGVYAVSNQGPEDARALANILAEEPWLEVQSVFSRPLTEMVTLPFGDPSRLQLQGWQNFYYHSGSGEFFQLSRIPLLRGRVFSHAESENRARVAIVSELAAMRLWGSTDDAIGRTIAMQPEAVPGQDWIRPRFLEATVVGVCRDIVVKARDGGPRPVIYFPDKLRPGTIVAVRGKGTPEQTRRLLGESLAKAPGAIRGATVVGLQETVDWETYPQQAASWLAALLSLVALVLTLSGIYGVMAYSVSQRRKEIGIRMALGADSLRIAKFVLLYTTRLAGVGLGAGLILAVGVLQFVASRVSLLVDLADFSAYGFSILTASVAALLAACGPVRRAIGVDPQSALRAE